MNIGYEFVVLLLALAVFKIAFFVSYERGPLEFMEKIRISTGRKANTGKTFWKEFAYFLNCPFCQGFWYSLIVSLIFFRHCPLSSGILYFFGVWGGQTVLQSISNIWITKEE